MKRITYFLLLVAMCIATDAYAQQLDPNRKPAAGPVPKSVFPPFSEAKLKNGVRVIIVEDHKQPMVWLRAAIMSGTASDGRYNGAANAVASLLDAGTSTRSKDEIARKLDFYGASVGAGADADGLDIFTSSMKKDLSEVLPLFADVIMNPTFPNEEVDKYINEQVSGLTAEKKNSAWPGRMLGRKLIYGEHPYGAIPSEEVYKSLSSELLNSWHDNNFKANNAIIAVVGAVKKAEILPMLEKHFGSWKSGTVEEPVFPALKPISGMPIYLINRPGSVQSTVRLQQLGLRRNDPNYDPAGFLAAIFAGNGSIGFQNRLFQNIREKHAYTYTPGGSLTASIDPGVLVAVAEVRNAVTDSALEQMLWEYRRLSGEPVNTEELTSAKSIVVGNYLMSLADPGMTAQRAIEIAKYNLPKNYFTSLAARVNAMNSMELQRVAQQVYPPNDIAVIVTGDASQIKDKLDRFGKVEVYDLDLMPQKAQSYAPSDRSLEEVVSTMFRKLGKDALAKVTSRTMSGTVEIDLGGQMGSGEMSIIQSAPRNMYEKVMLGMPTGGTLTIEQGTNGIDAWQKQTMGPQSQTIDMEEPSRATYIEDALFNEELHITDPDHKLALLGHGDVNGMKAYVLEITKPSGATKKWFVATDGNILRRVEVKEGGEQIMTMSDFREVDGVTYPFKAEITGPQTMTMRMTEIKHNLPAESVLFAKKK